MKATILSNGTVNDVDFLIPYIKNTDLFICADGGARYARVLSVKPDVLLGDFDSLDEDTLNYFKTIGTKIFRYPVAKNYTDTQLAIDKAIEMGSNEMVLLGVIGSRLDHTLANISMLYYLYERGVKAEIVNENNRIILLKGENVLKGKKGGTISFIPFLGDVEKITLRGFYYNLDEAELPKDISLGISNIFLGEEGYIDTGDDYILAIYSHDM
jgi:thiamine pyrophosphokinase